MIDTTKLKALAPATFVDVDNIDADEAIALISSKFREMDIDHWLRIDRDKNNAVIMVGLGDGLALQIDRGCLKKAKAITDTEQSKSTG